MSTRGLLFQFTSTIYSSSIKQTSFHKKKHAIITEIVHLALNNNQSLYETLRQNIKRMCIFPVVSYEI